MKVSPIAWLAVLVFAVIGTLCWWANRPPPRGNALPVANGQTAPAQPSGDKTNLSSGTPATTTVLGVRLRPLAVAKKTVCHEWAVENGCDTNVIRQLAHNELEYQRMLEENSRIKRRQLVYRKDTAAAVMQRARLSGESVKQLTLPGLDGQELQFAIEHADLAPSQQSGNFTGQLVGRPNSLVTLAFQFGREAFTILSPEDGTYLQGHPREPGEIILTSFDPETYQSLPGGEPIRTTNTFSIAQ